MASNGNVTAWLSVVGATFVTIVVALAVPNIAASTVVAYFAFIGGLTMGRYLIPSAGSSSGGTSTLPPVQSLSRRGYGNTARPFGRIGDSGRIE